MADGIGNAQLQRQCDEGEFDSLCTAGDCSCPFTIRRAQIMCEGDACFAAASIRVKKVKFERRFSKAGPYRVLTYKIVATVFDKKTLKPGPCDAVVFGETSSTFPDEDVTPEIENRVMKLVTKAILRLRNGVNSVCDERIRQAANLALDLALFPRNV